MYIGMARMPFQPVRSARTCNDARTHSAANLRPSRLCTPGRAVLSITAQRNQFNWQSRLERASAALRHLAAARQGPRADVTASLCIGAGASSLAYAGGAGSNGPNGGGGNGWGGGGGEGWQAGPSSVSNALCDVAVVGDTSSAAVEEVILLDVGGMKCGGCVGHVKKLLEDHPSVLHATVNLATETALVRVSLAAGADLDKLAADLAQVLTCAGFASTARQRRGTGWVSEAALNHKRQQKLDKLRKTTHDLVFAWGLSLLCGLGHLGHVWPAAPAWLHVLHHPLLAGALSAAALLGPGRDIITAGAQALAAGRPDMNSLVGLGAGASFAVSCAAAALPALRWKTFFEEPAMLLGFVLVGRALEERAKLQASSDMAALQGLMPQTARLALRTDAASSSSSSKQEIACLQQQGGSAPSSSSSSSEALRQHQQGETTGSTNSTVSSSTSDTVDSYQWVEVPADAVGPGDVLLVLPGDRVPVDGTVLSGRSTVDESALTGEPLPLLKKEGAAVTAGTLNCNGSLLVSAQASGQDTVIADIVRLVESAQARTAPIQRLADTVAGKFAFGVMALSAATFGFWSTVGARAFPHVLGAAAGGAAAAAACCCLPAAGGVFAAGMPSASAVLLGLQLACNVLVVACPCALGLATPTAVLVGTAAGARKGLLVRGGDILEATSQVDTVVFDKTGTLTAGKPVVAGITMLNGSSSSSSGDKHSHSSSSGSSSSSISPRLMLQLAAAVEQQATHPLGRALVAAAAADRDNTTAAGTAAGTAAAIETSSSSSRWHDHHRSSSTDGGSLEDTESAARSGSSFSADQGTFLQEPGSGAVAVVAGHRVSVGTLEWVQRQGCVLTPEAVLNMQLTQQQAEQQASSGSNSTLPASTTQSSSGSTGAGRQSNEPLTGHTQVFVGVDGAVVGLMDVADMIRSDARSTVLELQQLGLRTVMLSGDRQESALKVAAAVGIPAEDVHAGIKPAGKAALVEQLKAQGRRVAMVGDGINDTAALAAADVGMAMAGGVDAASDVSKVVLMGDQLHQVADAIELSRKTLAKIQQNLGWAFCYNIVGIPLAAGVLLPKYGLALTPSISGALMGVSSLAVMANSLLLQLEVKGMRNGLQTAAAAAARPGEAAAAVVAAAHNRSGRPGGAEVQQQAQQRQAGGSRRGAGLQLAAAAEAASAAE